jgi:hypothetical protein
MTSVNSFDIFDTLLARSVQNPTDIYRFVEINFPYTNFAKLRHEAHIISNNTIDDIYRKFKVLTGESDDMINKLREFEIETEMKNTIPIRSNISKIQDGDILVSDMYLTHSDITRLLDYHMISKKITLYVQPDGKSSGRIWPELKNKYNIVYHMGDNLHSDIEMASRYNINTVYTEIYKFTRLESQLVGIDFELNKLLRTFRLSNPYSIDSIEYNIFSQQIEYNIPILLFICRKLANILKKENRDTVLFLTRDGCFIIQLFRFLYPNYKSIYLHSSRIINKVYNEEYVNYLKSLYKKDECIIFDLHGSFSSGRELFIETFGHLPRIFIFDISILENYYDEMTYVSSLSSQFLEYLNQDIRGTLVNYINGKDIRMPPDWPVKYLNCMSKTIENFIVFIDKDLILNSEIFNDDVFWKNYYEETSTFSSNILFKHVIDKTKCTLIQLSEKFQYKCENIRKYEEIIDDVITLNNSRQIDLLEINLNTSDSISYHTMWNDYFSNCNNITKYFSDGMIYTLIDGKNTPLDLEVFKNTSYDIIMDKGTCSEMNEHITFKNIWQCMNPGGYYIIENYHISNECTTKYIIDTLTESISDIELKHIIQTKSAVNWLSNSTNSTIFVYIKKLHDLV